MPGVYVSYPFCAQKCTYCNFASGVFPSGTEPRYLDALRAEIERHSWAWRPETVYLGGGTPSAMPPEALASLLARIPASMVTVVDINPARAALAQAFGCTFASPEAAPTEQDLIIHTSATGDGLRLCLLSAAVEARIVEASWYGDTAPTLPLGEAFHARRLRLIASQVGQVAPSMRGRRSHAERLTIALTLLGDARYDALLEGPTQFADLPGKMPELLRLGGLCHVVTYDHR